MATEEKSEKIKEPKHEAKNLLTKIEISKMKLMPSATRRADVIGHGLHGRVYQGIYNGRKVAVKDVFNHRDLLKDPKYCVNRKIKKVNDVIGYGIEDEGKHNQNIFFLTEYQKNKQLNQYLNDKKIIDIHLDTRLTFMLNIIEGIENIQKAYPEEKFTDYSTFNVFVTDSLGAKIKHPLMSNLFDKYNRCVGGQSFVNFFSPEELKGLEILDTKTYEQIIVRRIGGILFHLITRGYPFSDVKSQSEIADKIKKGESLLCKPDIETNAEEFSELVELFKECWNLDGSKRPSISYIKRKLKDIKKKLRKTITQHMMSENKNTEKNLPKIDHSLMERMPSELNRRDRIGNPRHGEVYRGKYNNQCVAIRYYSQPDNLVMIYPRFFPNKKIKNVVNMIGYGIDHDEPFIVMEYFKKGSLSDYIESKKNIPLNIRVNLAYDVINGLQNIEETYPERNFTEITTNNIYVTNSLSAKIKHPFMSNKLSRINDDTVTEVNNRFSSPEEIKRLGVNDAKTRKEIIVYKFGVVLFHLLTGKAPFHDLKKCLIIAKKIATGDTPQCIPNVTTDQEVVSKLVELVENCWNLDGSKRPTLEKIKKILEQLQKFLKLKKSLNQLQKELGFKKTLCEDESMKEMLPELDYNKFIPPINELKRNNLLGECWHGSVYKVTYDNRTVAIKVFTCGYKNYENIVTKLNEWVNQTVGNVVNIIGFAKNECDKQIVIVIEYFARNTVQDFIDISNKNNIHVPLTNRIKIAKGIVRGFKNIMKIYPEKGITNISSANVYLTDSFNAKIKSPLILGLIESDTDRRQYYFSAPEELKDLEITDVKIYEKILAYNCGSLFFQLITGKRPFDDVKTASEIIKKIIEGKTPTCKPNVETNKEKYSKLVALVIKCWALNPSERPSLEDIEKEIEEIEEIEEEVEKESFESKSTKGNLPVINADEFKPQLPDLKNPDLICEGIYGALYRVTYDGRLIAIKLYSRDRDIEDQLEKMICQASENFVNIIGFGKNDDYIFIAIEYFENGSVNDYIGKSKKKGGKEIPLIDRVNIALGIVGGLKSLKKTLPKKKVTEITSSNVYVTKDLSVKIKSPHMLDLLKGFNTKTCFEKKYYYTSPELIKGAINSDVKISDAKTYEQILAYNYGGLLFELITDKIPFEGLPKYAVENNIIEGKIPLCEPSVKTNKEEYSKLVELVIKCWSLNPSERPSLEDIEKVLEEVKKQVKKGD
jgi:serine/threonine protein kinase